MINLLPPAARVGVQREYWLRVVTVWLLLISSAFIVGSIILLPSYVLITSQVDVYQASAEEISTEVASYEDVSTDLIRANQQAAFLIDEDTLLKFSDLLDLFQSFESDAISISQVNMSRDGLTIGSILVQGTALDRQALAAFRDELLADPMIEQVVLPIENLAQGSNIKFSITVTLKANQPAV